MYAHNNRLKHMYSDNTIRTDVTYAVTDSQMCSYKKQTHRYTHTIIGSNRCTQTMQTIPYLPMYLCSNRQMCSHKKQTHRYTDTIILKEMYSYNDRLKQMYSYSNKCHTSIGSQCGNFPGWSVLYNGAYHNHISGQEEGPLSNCTHCVICLYVLVGTPLHTDVLPR